MTILVTGSAGHLGEGVMRVLRAAGRPARGLDIKTSAFTDIVASITDRGAVTEAMRGVRQVIHAATLHKPHVATHAWQDFVDVNISGTLALLEVAAEASASAFVFTSTTSVYSRAVAQGGDAAVWVDETVTPAPKNIYGVTKLAAESLCELMHRRAGLACLVLRTSRFFPEPDDERSVRQRFDDANAKVNELLYRRVDLQDAVDALLLAAERAPAIGFDRFIISATTPFSRTDLAQLAGDAPGVVARVAADYADFYRARGWAMLPSVDRVYDNSKARQALAWHPRYDFTHALTLLREGKPPMSELSQAVGAKGYHSEIFADGPYPVER